MHYTLLGKKIGMTQLYDGNNTLVPVTLIEAGPCPVVQVKTQESDGYYAIQLGFGQRNPSRVTKAHAGHLKKAGLESTAYLQEVRHKEKPEVKAGDILTVSGFSENQKVDIVGVCKGRGFQGVVKRYGFHGGPSSHGSMFHRRGGSYGQCQWPGEIYKGRKMPGHMGHVRRTMQNLKIMKVSESKNLLLVKGSVPGAKGTRVLVRTAKKTRSQA